MPNDLQELIGRCQAGDRAAFRELFRQHRVGVLRLIQRLMGGGNELEDLVQEVFLQVHRSIKDFRGDARFSTWLHRVTVNVVLMYRRSEKSRPIFVHRPDTVDVRDSQPSPDEQLARQHRVQAFYRLVDQLSEKKRTVYVLHELEGMAPAEIARVVRAPVLTVRTRLFYARRELVALFGSEPSLSGLCGPSGDGRLGRKLSSAKKEPA